MEELWAIIEMIEGLGGSAQEAFIWYLIYKFVGNLIGWGVLITVVTLGYKLINNAITNIPWLINRITKLVNETR